jgi:acylphosphatase
MSLARGHVFVSGRVQGVNFRYSTLRQAEADGITGWVRNFPDGRVEAVFEGEESKVLRMVQWCHKGPPRARVDLVDLEWLAYSGEFESFEVLEYSR